MNFKKPELMHEGTWFSRTFQNTRFRKSILYICLGAMLGFVFYYLAEGMHMDAMPQNEIIQSIVAGAFLGFFITNSPCARGRC